MSNPLKSFVLKGFLKKGQAKTKINTKYANIFVGIWELSLIDFFVKFSRLASHETENVAFTVSTNLVSGETFNLNQQTVHEDVVIRCVAAVASDNAKELQVHHYQPLWFQVNAPSDNLEIKLGILGGKVEDNLATFICNVVMRRIA